MINKVGGKFMIMTATLPRIYKEELIEKGIKFEYKEFIKDTKRHKIKIEDKKIIEDIEKIKKKGKKNKVLVIVNTVNKAIELYERLKCEEMENINLLHSRFIQNDRNEKEKNIKIFSKDRDNNGIWITTQIVEASLDIDFDYLYTEMSTLDSLFQRLGRCYRSREYDKEEPNIYIYTKEPSGIKYVYDKDISEKSIDLLREFDCKMLREKTKIELVDKLYSKEMLDGTEFYQKFKAGKEVLDNIIDYNTSKKDAQKLLRNIDNITVIPKIIYDENLELFKKYEKENNYKERNKIKREINKLTTTISKSQKWILKEKIINNPYGLEDIFIADLRYNKDIGLF